MVCQFCSGESPVHRGDRGGAAARDSQAGDGGDEAGTSQVLSGIEAMKGYREGERKTVSAEGSLMRRADARRSPTTSR